MNAQAERVAEALASAVVLSGGDQPEAHLANDGIPTAIELVRAIHALVDPVIARREDNDRGVLGCFFGAAYWLLAEDDPDRFAAEVWEAFHPARARAEGARLHVLALRAPSCNTGVPRDHRQV